MPETAPHNYLDNEPLNIGVVGATGEVGRIMLGILDERGLPIDNLRLFASERSAGMPLDWRDSEVVVEDANVADYSGLDVVLFSAGAEVSRRLAPQVVDSGAIVIDNSSAWRHNTGVPLVVSEVNPEELDHMPLGIVANPNCSTMVAMPVLKPLHDMAGLEAIVVSTYQAVSGAGRGGNTELVEQIKKEDTSPQVFPEPIAYNVIPLRGNLVGRNTDEELKLKHESRRILRISQLMVSATCVSVPVFTGHSLSIDARFTNKISPEEAEHILKQSAGVELSAIPTPRRAAGGDTILVGRIRQSGVFGENGLSIFMAGDNLRKGAALNAVQILELLIRRSGSNPRVVTA
jgi:aspartate-semialdehyde dehydrogenase